MIFHLIAIQLNFTPNYREEERQKLRLADVLDGLFQLRQLSN